MSMLSFLATRQLDEECGIVPPSLARLRGDEDGSISSSANSPLSECYGSEKYGGMMEGEIYKNVTISTEIEDMSEKRLMEDPR